MAKSVTTLMIADANFIPYERNLGKGLLMQRNADLVVQRVVLR